MFGGIIIGGKTSAAVKNRYNAKKYDVINLTVDKGNKAIIQAAAAAAGQSTNEYIRDAVKRRMQSEAAPAGQPSNLEGGEME